MSVHENSTAIENGRYEIIKTILPLLLGPKAGCYNDNNNPSKPKVTFFMPLQLYKLYSII
jgi:hypothetical protein